MANITEYTDQIASAVYGEEVRGSIIGALNKVNDDNNSYQAIKDDIVKEKENIENQVGSFDAKLANAQSITSGLEQAITDGNTARNLLQSSISSANTTKKELDTSNQTAKGTKTGLDTTVSNAEKVKQDILNAQTNLQNVIDNSITQKGLLQSAIDSATVINNQLTTTNSTASTAKSNLEAAITSATTSKGNLEATITSASTAYGEMSAIINAASSEKSDLQSVISNASALETALENSIQNAQEDLSQLELATYDIQECLDGITEIKSYLGMITEGILGVQIDYANKTSKPLHASGIDFDDFEMYGGRKKCTVDDTGAITSFYGDSNYTENGSIGQVMVYQPKFYYKVVPLALEGTIMRKANYYVSTQPYTGFKVHPAFYDSTGNELDYILIGAYEGSIWDKSANKYITDDSQIMDAANDKWCSVGGVRPASGITQDLTRPNVNQMCKNRGAGFYSYNMRAVSANQLLMMVELGTMNFQTAIANGVVSIPDNSSYNCASYTGSTSTIGNGTGQAASTKDYSGTTQTANGKTAVSYRGLENPWGNIWEFVYGINIYIDTATGEHQAYIATDYEWEESKKTDNYQPVGFNLAKANGYISAMGYNELFDWVLMPTEVKGNSAVPVGDYFYQSATSTGFRIVLLGGGWADGGEAGPFHWSVNAGVGTRYRAIGGRLVYIPTKGSNAYNAAVALWKQKMAA